MPNHAIVIGINAYGNSEWNLSAAVGDALNFAEWALKYGDVSEQNLHLMLSVSQPNVTTRPYLEASRRNIVKTIQKFQKNAGQGGGRLYFYYAGHGLSSPGATRGKLAEPVLIPPDVADLETDYNDLIPFSEIIPLLVGVEPREQFFFIDACRDFGLEDFQPAIGGVGPWSPGSAEAGARSNQYWLYATSPGGKAAEERGLRGKGVFGAALMDALEGRGAGTPALELSQYGNAYEVRPRKLIPYLKNRIRKEIGDAKQWQQFLQVPEYNLRGDDPDPVLASFDPSRVSKLNLAVRVTPGAARKRCQVQVLLPSQVGDLPVPDGKAKGSANPDPFKFQFPPGVYAVEVKARDFTTKREPCELYEPRTLDFAMTQDAEAEGSRTFRGEQGQTTGALKVLYSDPTGLIIILNSAYENLTRDAGERPDFSRANLAPGIYRVQLVLPGGPAQEKLVEVIAGKTTEVRLDPPDMQLGEAQVAMLAARGIKLTEAGYLDAAEYLPEVSGASLASILGFAAYAVHWQGPRFERLRSLGVRTLNPANGKAGLLVLVGASGDEPAPDYTVEKFLNAARLQARLGDGRPIEDSGFSVLTGFPAAAQFADEVVAGPASVRLDLPGSASTSYAVACLPDRIAVLIAVADDSGGYEIQQYSLPVGSRTAPGGIELLRDNPSDIRRLELAQRYYTAGHDVLPSGNEMTDLLYGKWLDPLLGCLAGYSLITAGRAAEYVGQPNPAAAPTEPEPSAMRNMLKFYPDLPDSHVLAGLCAPERRAEHYANALAHGLPVFAEGTRALIEWYATEDKSLPPQLASANRGLLPGSPWTTWAVSRPALIIQKGSFSRPLRGWEELEVHRAEIEKAIRSVGRIEIDDGSGYRHMGTGWVIAEGIVATASFVAESFARKQEAGYRFLATFTGAPYEARIDFHEEYGGQEPFEVAIEEVLFCSSDRSSPSIALLKLARHADWPSPLALAAKSPENLAGRRVYTVGYPAFDPRYGTPGLTFQKRTFGNVFEVKRLQPGESLGLGERGSSHFEHDCATAGGNGGGPVIDIQTGLVLGLHEGGTIVEDIEGVSKRNWAVALWTLKDSILAQINAIYV